MLPSYPLVSNVAILLATFWTLAFLSAPVAMSARRLASGFMLLGAVCSGLEHHLTLCGVAIAIGLKLWR